MGYTNCLTIGQMKEMDILDEVPYKYFKRFHDDDDIEVNIYHIDNDRPAYGTVVFEYEFEYDCSDGCMPIYTTKKFKTKITYNTSSAFALFLYSISEDTDDEDTDNEDTDNEDTDEDTDEDTHDEDTDDEILE